MLRRGDKILGYFRKRRFLNDPPRYFFGSCISKRARSSALRSLGSQGSGSQAWRITFTPSASLVAEGVDVVRILHQRMDPTLHL